MIMTRYSLRLVVDTAIYNNLEMDEVYSAIMSEANFSNISAVEWFICLVDMKFYRINKILTKEVKKDD